MPVIAVIAAVALALGTTAFKPEKPLVNTTMYYQGGSFSQANVQNKSNWSATTQPCSAGTAKACQVTVPSTVVSGGAFISTVSLDASAGTPSALTDVKNSGATVHPAIQNKPN